MSSGQTAMLPIPLVMQSHRLCNDSFRSTKLFSAYCGKYGQMFASGCQKLDLQHKASYGKPVRHVRRNSDENHVPKAVATPDVSVVKTSEDVATYRFWMEVGGQLKVLVKKKKNNKYGLWVEVESSQISKGQGELIMIWGIFRDDSTSLVSLDVQQPRSDSRYGTVETPFVKDSVGRLVVELDFDERLAPFYVSILLKSQLGPNSKVSTIRSQWKTNFNVPVGFFSGRPSPMGISFQDGRFINFAFFSRSADSVVLCLYADNKGEKLALELDLDPYVNRTGGIWHALLDCSMFASYGYRCRTDIDKKGRCVSLDPYAKVLDDFHLGLTRKYIGNLCKEPTFDWSDEHRPNIPMQKLIIYRLNVAHFTEHKSCQLSSSDIAGSFSGVSEKLHHFKDLGVNAILLEPIFPFNEQKGPYFPWHFFSPSSSYGPSGNSIAVVNSMKEMIKKLHAHEIEVLLEVVFTDTSNDEVTSKSALNCNHPVVQQMILEILHHWVVEYHIDGFCFVNAPCLMRSFHGELLSRPPLVEAIAFDPILSKVKLIADSWDPYSMDAMEIVFPHWKRWAEMNEKFSVDVRNFLRGQGLISNLATRLCGSGDMFLSGRSPAFSFNFITRNAGLTLVDLVSFSSGNLASQNSWNCGEEGPTKKASVLETRLKQIRNFLFILFVSLGVPVLNMGDECGQSCSGSPAYADRKPLDWNAVGSGYGVQITQFISFLSSLKARRSDLLQNRNFLKEDSIEWQGAEQSPPGWDDPSCKFLAVTLKANTESSQATPASLDAGSDLFLAFNSADHPEKVTLPPPPVGTRWACLVDTALPFPGFFTEDGVLLEAALMTYDVEPHSCTLFEARVMS